MRKAGQTWHYLARKELEGVQEIYPFELADRLGVHYQKATKLLESLGWSREKQKSGRVKFRREAVQK